MKDGDKLIQRINEGERQRLTEQRNKHLRYIRWLFTQDIVIKKGGIESWQ